MSVDGAGLPPAAEARQDGVGPIASSLYWGGMFTAFFMDRPFVGAPAGATLADCKAEMAATGVGTFLVHPGWKFAAELARDPDWVRVRTLHPLPDQAIDVYVPRSP